MIEIRKAETRDSEEIVDVMLRTWRTTYSGIISESYMAEREAKREDRIIKIRESIGLSNSKDIESYYCTALDNGKVIGFAYYGKYRNEGPHIFENAGEIYALYILKEYQRHGIGKKLVNHAVLDLMHYKCDMVVIWALKANPSIGFYKKIGGEERLTQNIEMGSQILQEIGFVFDDINRLFRNTK